MHPVDARPDLLISRSVFCCFYENQPTNFAEELSFYGGVQWFRTKLNVRQFYRIASRVRRLLVVFLFRRKDPNRILMRSPVLSQKMI